MCGKPNLVISDELIKNADRLLQQISEKCTTTMDHMCNMKQFTLVTLADIPLKAHVPPSLFDWLEHLEELRHQNRVTTTMWFQNIYPSLHKNEPQGMQELRQKHNPTTTEELIRALVSEFGQSNFYQQVLTQAHQKVGPISKLNFKTASKGYKALSAHRNALMNVQSALRYYRRNFEDAEGLLANGLLSNSYITLLTKRESMTLALEINQYSSDQKLTTITICYQKLFATCEAILKNYNINGSNKGLAARELPTQNSNQNQDQKSNQLISQKNQEIEDLTKKLTESERRNENQRQSERRNENQRQNQRKDENQRIDRKRNQEPDKYTDKMFAIQDTQHFNKFQMKMYNHAKHNKPAKNHLRLQKTIRTRIR